jgi:hypothetical protein
MCSWDRTITYIDLNGEEHCFEDIFAPEQGPAATTILAQKYNELACASLRLVNKYRENEAQLLEQRAQLVEQRAQLLEKDNQIAALEATIAGFLKMEK